MACIERRVSKDGEVSFRADVNIAGFPRVKETFDKKRDAENWARETEIALRSGAYSKASQARLHTVSEMIDRYIDTVLEIKTDRTRFKEIQRAQLLWWRHQLGDYELSNLTPAAIGNARDNLFSTGKRPRKGSTVNRYLAALSHVLTTAYKEWGWLPENPIITVKKMKETRGRVRFLSDDERTRLLVACQNEEIKPLYLIVMMAIGTAARKNELLTLNKSDLDLKRGIITVHNTKNGERRSLFLSPTISELLQNHLKARRIKDGPIFPSRRGRAVISIDTEFRKALKEARIKDFRFHDLRHTAASYLAMNDASSTVIAEILGHKTLSMVKRYAHLSKAHSAEVVNKMNEKVFNQDGVQK